MGLMHDNIYKGIGRHESYCLGHNCSTYSFVECQHNRATSLHSICQSCLFYTGTRKWENSKQQATKPIGYVMSAPNEPWYPHIDHFSKSRYCSRQLRHLLYQWHRMPAIPRFQIEAHSGARGLEIIRQHSMCTTNLSGQCPSVVGLVEIKNARKS